MGNGGLLSCVFLSLCFGHPISLSLSLSLSLLSIPAGKSLGKRRVHMCNLICWGQTAMNGFSFGSLSPPFSSRVLVKAVFVMRHLIPRKRSGLSVYLKKSEKLLDMTRFPPKRKNRNLFHLGFFSLCFSRTVWTPAA